MTDLMKLILGDSTDQLTPADLTYLYLGGISGYGLDVLARAYDNMFNPGGKTALWIDALGLIGSSLGAIFLEPPWNAWLAGTGTGFLVAITAPTVASTARTLIASTARPAVSGMPPTVYVPPVGRAPTLTQRGTYIIV